MTPNYCIFPRFFFCSFLLLLFFGSRCKSSQMSAQSVHASTCQRHRRRRINREEEVWSQWERNETCLMILKMISIYFESLLLLWLLLIAPYSIQRVALNNNTHYTFEVHSSSSSLFCVCTCINCCTQVRHVTIIKWMEYMEFQLIRVHTPLSHYLNPSAS